MKTWRLYLIAVFILIETNIAFAGNFLNELGKVLDAYSSIENNRRLDDSIQQIINRNGVAKIGVIVDVRVASLSEQERKDYSDMLSNRKQAELLKTYAIRRNEIKFVERSQLQPIIEEQKFAMSGLTETNTVQIGKLAGLDIIFLYTAFQTQTSFKAILVNTGEILAIQTDNASLMPRKQTLINQTYNVPAGNYQPIGFTFPQNSVVEINFQSNQDINVWFITEVDLIAFSRNNRFNYYPTASGQRIYNGNFTITIPMTGAYYFVLDNRFSIMTPKRVSVSITATTIGKNGF